MRARLAETPASAFMADCTFAICLVFEPSIVHDACRERKLEEALDKLEAFFARYDAEAKNIDPRYADGHAPGSRVVKKPRQFRRRRPNA